MTPTPSRLSVWSVAVRAAVVVLAVLVGVPVLMGTVYTWNGSWEASPAGTDPLSDGAQRIRDLKENLRKRLAAELNIGTSGPDDGRLRAGAARVFVSATAPTVLNGPGDLTASTALDAGRVWVDTSTTPAVVKYYTGSAWAVLAGQGAVPANGIILWDQANGDVNCDGTPGAGECPCGYTEATEFRNLAVRGADTAATTVTIPNSPGVSCDSDYGHGVGSGCSSGFTESYSDTPSTVTMAQHHHTVGTTDVSLGAGRTGIGASSSENTTNTGDTNVWPGPFRTVLFCRKS